MPTIMKTRVFITLVAIFFAETITCVQGQSLRLRHQNNTDVIQKTETPSNGNSGKDTVTPAVSAEKNQLSIGEVVWVDEKKRIAVVWLDASWSYHHTLKQDTVLTAHDEKLKKVATLKVVPISKGRAIGVEILDGLPEISNRACTEETLK